MYPTKQPTIIATEYYKMSNVNSLLSVSVVVTLRLLKILSIEHKIRAIPAPLAQPIIPMVRGKNFLPVKATKSPKIIAIGPKI